MGSHQQATAWTARPRVAGACRAIVRQRRPTPPALSRDLNTENRPHQRRQDCGHAAGVAPGRHPESAQGEAVGHGAALRAAPPLAVRRTLCLTLASCLMPHVSLLSISRVLGRTTRCWRSRCGRLSRRCGRRTCCSRRRGGPEAPPEARASAAAAAAAAFSTLPQSLARRRRRPAAGRARRAAGVEQRASRGASFSRASCVINGEYGGRGADLVRCG